MLGAFAVGKTSLVARFVSSIFSDKYLTTVGVKISKKILSVDGKDMTVLLWDIYGQDDFQTVQPSHVRGAGGYLLVADGTRRATLDIACALQEKVAGTIGAVPFVLVINKSDLADQWEIDAASLAGIERRGWTVIKTSAKSGDGVGEAFLTLARGMSSGERRSDGT
jgi:small GTP-binding protein